MMAEEAVGSRLENSRCLHYPPQRELGADRGMTSQEREASMNSSEFEVLPLRGGRRSALPTLPAGDHQINPIQLIHILGHIRAVIIMCLSYNLVKTRLYYYWTS